jgi:hypothetical protein
MSSTRETLPESSFVPQLAQVRSSQTPHVAARYQRPSSRAATPACSAQHSQTGPSISPADKPARDKPAPAASTPLGQHPISQHRQQRHPLCFTLWRICIYAFISASAFIVVHIHRRSAVRVHPSIVAVTNRSRSRCARWWLLAPSRAGPQVSDLCCTCNADAV